MGEPENSRREQSVFLRRMAYWGARRGPQTFLRLSPKPIGAAFGLALPDVRRRIVSNLRRIHGPRGALREQLDALTTLANYAACFAEGMAAVREDAAPKVQIRGESHLRAAIERGGALLVTAHVGPWDLTAQLLRQTVSADVVVVMEPEPNPQSRAFQDALRDQRGVRVLHIGAHPTDALPLIAHLRRGGVAALQMDRVPPSGRVLDVSLFGAPFRVPEGPFRLAALSGAWIVPVFARRLGFFDYEMSISEPIVLPRRASHAQLLASAQSASDAMQAFVRESPTQWFHFGGE
jgi:lauroyl/myristoyl acyltransferase